MDLWIRRARPDDMAAIVALNDAAFGGPAEGRIVRALCVDGDSLLSLIAADEKAILGHIEFFRILIGGVPAGAGLGPMSAAPGRQKQGIGSGLVRIGLTALEGAGEKLVFVLGHDTYYPKFGFTEAAATPYTAPWSGPHFMARHLAPGAPAGGTLAYPRAFGG